MTSSMISIWILNRWRKYLNIWKDRISMCFVSAPMMTMIDDSDIVISDEDEVDVEKIDLSVPDGVSIEDPVQYVSERDR